MNRVLATMLILIILEFPNLCHISEHLIIYYRAVFSNVCHFITPVIYTNAESEWERVRDGKAMRLRGSTVIPEIV